MLTIGQFTIISIHDNRAGAMLAEPYLMVFRDGEHIANVSEVEPPYYPNGYFTPREQSEINAACRRYLDEKAPTIKHAMTQQEAVTKASHSALFLSGELQEAHKIACDGNPVLAMLLRDLIADSVSVKNKLVELEGLLIVKE